MQTLRKLRILIDLLSGALDQWRTEVLPYCLDSIYCCNGSECGCRGVTRGGVYGEVKARTTGEGEGHD